MANIMIVDDTNSMRQMISFTLNTAGYDVTEARDGDEAFALAKKTQADLVITDVNMPNMDGISLVKALRGLPGYQKIPILMLTTESSMRRKEEGKAAGATGWIVKPFDPEQLIQMVKTVLS